MNHMPYEDTGMSAIQEVEPQQGEPTHEEPGRTPQSAEGLDEDEREMPGGEPGRTPGSAEGEDPDLFPNAPRY